jgi:YHS domain-containing protein
VKDCVCGKEVPPAETEGSGEYRGQIFYFCSPECRLRFEEDPARYAASQEGKPRSRRGRKPAGLLPPDSGDLEDSASRNDADDEPRELV